MPPSAEERLASRNSVGTPMPAARVDELGNPAGILVSITKEKRTDDQRSRLARFSSSLCARSVRHAVTQTSRDLAARSRQIIRLRPGSSAFAGCHEPVIWTANDIGALLE